MARLESPVFVVAGPGGDAALIAQALSRLPGLWHRPDGAAEPSADLLDGLVDHAGDPVSDTTAAVRPVLAADAGELAALAARHPDARFVLTAAPGAVDWPDASPAPDRSALVDATRLIDDPHGALLGALTLLGLPFDQALLPPIEARRRQRDGGDPAAGRIAFASQHTASFPQLLDQLGASLLVSTYQSGRLICARPRADGLNTHFRAFDKPMGIAVGAGRFALGTRTEVWDFRDVPAVAPKVEPAGTHDACFLPRHRHTTGDIAIHEMAWAGGELWLVATGFSCLATLDADHSFVPRWRPPFVSALAPGDRCHLNGMAVRDDRVTHVTALGTTDEPGGWRARKADGGVLLDVASGEVVSAGLSMPHSPRWHDGRLYVLESGRGELCTVDEATGDRTVVAQLPGFARGLALAGPIAFVGLSQIRESSTFGDLPITQRLQERVSGVWAVDLRTGEVAAFLRFEDLVQEVFDVALLPGARNPEIAEPGSSAVAATFVLP